MNARLTAVALLFASGCAGEPDGPGDGSSASPMHYAVGLASTGGSGALEFTLEDALPAPPGRGTNRWHVQIRTSSGEPAAGATLTKLRPWMPDHGHGAATKPTTAVDADGLVTVDGLELVMPGVWTVTVAAEHEGVADEGTFAFCIVG
jgi:hypothetical protein